MKFIKITRYDGDRPAEVNYYHVDSINEVVIAAEEVKAVLITETDRVGLTDIREIHQLISQMDALAVNSLGEKEETGP